MGNTASTKLGAPVVPEAAANSNERSQEKNGPTSSFSEAASKLVVSSPVANLPIVRLGMPAKESAAADASKEPRAWDDVIAEARELGVLHDEDVSDLLHYWSDDSVARIELQSCLEIAVQNRRERDSSLEDLMQKMRPKRDEFLRGSEMPAKRPFDRALQNLDLESKDLASIGLRVDQLAKLFDARSFPETKPPESHSFRTLFKRAQITKCLLFGVAIRDSDMVEQNTKKVDPEKVEELMKNGFIEHKDLESLLEGCQYEPITLRILFENEKKSGLDENRFGLEQRMEPLFTQKVLTDDDKDVPLNVVRRPVIHEMMSELIETLLLRRADVRDCYVGPHSTQCETDASLKKVVEAKVYEKSTVLNQSLDQILQKINSYSEKLNELFIDCEEKMKAIQKATGSSKEQMANWFRREPFENRIDDVHSIIDSMHACTGQFVFLSQNNVFDDARYARLVAYTYLVDHGRGMKIQEVFDREYLHGLFPFEEYEKRLPEVDQIIHALYTHSDLLTEALNAEKITLSGLKLTLSPSDGVGADLNGTPIGRLERFLVREGYLPDDST